MNNQNTNAKGIIKLIFIAVFMTTLYSCKKNGTGNANTDQSIANVTGVLNTQKGAAFTFMNSMKSGKDSLDAFIDMVNWVLQQPDVSKAFITNASIVRIVYKSGMEGFISAIPMDAQDKPLYQGGVAEI